MAWMPKSVCVQDERYNAMAWMPKSVCVQDERYNAMAWMPKSVCARKQNRRVAEFCSRQILSSCIHAGKIPRGFEPKRSEPILEPATITPV